MPTQKENLIKQIEETEKQLSNLKKELKEAETKFDYRSIKSFEDACKRLGIDGEAEIVKYRSVGLSEHLIANFQLERIFEAINDGWIPDWNNSNKRKYYPWFTMSSDSFASSGYGSWCTDSVSGSRLCTYNKNVSDYIGKTFVDIYKVALSY